MINTYVPYLGIDEKKFVINCINSNFISSAGPDVKKFEDKFCKKYNFKFAIALNSGTSALHLALKLHNIGLNDLVIIPSYTFAATANAVKYTGAEPYFFDCDKNLLLDLKYLEKFFFSNTKNTLIQKYKKKIKAIMPVLTMGQEINFRKYEKFAKEKNLKVIFDAAACHNPKIIQKKALSNSIYCFSFNGNKTLTTGAGGILATNSKSLANKARILSNVGKIKGNYDYQDIGYNYKMTNMQANLGLSQLKNLNKILKKKKIIFDYYEKKLKNNSNFFIIHDKDHINWVFALILKRQNQFKIIKRIFNNNNIQLDYFWKPLHLQNPYKKFKKSKLATSEIVWKKVIILPSHPGVNKTNQNKICKILNKI